MESFYLMKEGLGFLFFCFSIDVPMKLADWMACRGTLSLTDEQRHVGIR